MSQGSEFETATAAVQSQVVSQQDDFQRALREGNVQEVSRLLEIDRSLVNKSFYGTTPLVVYAIEEHASFGRSALELVALVQLLLDHQADINARNELGQSALYIAVDYDFEPVVELLLQYHADVNVCVYKSGLTPLMVVKSAQVARLLIAHGADVNGKGHEGYTPLCSSFDVEIAGLLMANGADINSKDAYGYPVWLSAIDYLCDLETFKLIIHQAGNQDLKATWGDKGWSALHQAAAMDHLQIMQYILDQGVDVDVRATADGKTALHIAVEYCRNRGDLALPRVQFLLQRGAHVNATDHHAKTPFAYISYRNADVMQVAKLLVDHGAVVDGKKVLLKDAKRRNPYTSMVEFILEHGKVDINARDSHNSNTLPFQMLDKLANRRARKKYRPIFMLLIQHGADVKAKHRQSGWTLLHFAVAGYQLVQTRMRDEFDLEVQLLLEQGSAINAVDKEGYTPLLLSIHYSNWKIVRILVNHGADVNIGWKDISTPLSLTCNRYEEGLVQLLLDAGARVDYRLKNGVTALLICAREGCVRDATLLLERGADINAADNKGWTPLLMASFAFENIDMTSRTPKSMARVTKQVGMVQLLLEAGAQVDHRDRDCVTALLNCVRKGMVTCATMLLERGADIHAADKYGCTPFLLACRKEKLDLIYSLIRSSPHHRRLGLLCQASYPSTATGSELYDNEINYGDEDAVDDVVTDDNDEDDDSDDGDDSDASTDDDSSDYDTDDDSDDDL